MTGDLAARTAGAHAEAWRALARATGRELIERDGLLTYFSMAAKASFNPTVVLAAPRDPDAALDRIEDLYIERGIPFGFQTFDDMDPAVERAALARGMTLHMTEPAMALHPLPKLEPAPFEIVEATDAEGLRRQLETQAAGFGDAMPDLEIFAPPSALAAARHFLGFVDGVPAATSVLVVTGAEAGIFGVCTRPEFRRRGLGRAMTEAAARAAVDEGCDLAYLHASAEGFPVYRAIGFVPVREVRIWLAKAP